VGVIIPFDPELEKLVQEVKSEMIRDGLRYQGNIIGRPRVLDKPRRVKVEKKKPYVKPDWWPIQFRGTPGKKSKLPEIIKGRRVSFKYFGGNDGE